MYSELEKRIHHINSMSHQFWMHHDLFTFKWWLLVVLNLIFIALFILLIDRNRILLISFTFAVSFIIVGTINEIGAFYGYWGYPHQFLVFTHRFNAVDFGIVPVIMSLIYQWFVQWKPYLIASLIISLIVGFIGVPVFRYLEMYTLHHWHYYYSFLITFIMVIFMKMIVDFICRKDKVYTNESH